MSSCGGHEIDLKNGIAQDFVDREDDHLPQQGMAVHSRLLS
jgi:hypothetical protein